MIDEFKMLIFMCSLKEWSVCDFLFITGFIQAAFTGILDLERFVLAKTLKHHSEKIRLFSCFTFRTIVLYSFQNNVWMKLQSLIVTAFRVWSVCSDTDEGEISEILSLELEKSKVLS